MVARWCLQGGSRTVNVLFGLFVRCSLVRLCQKKERFGKAVTCQKKTRTYMTGRLPRTQQNKQKNCERKLAKTYCENELRI